MWMNASQFASMKSIKWMVKLSHLVKEPAVKLGVDDQLRKVRATLHPVYRREYIDSQNLKLLMAFALQEDANCIDIGAHSGSVLAEMVRLSPRGQHIAYEPLPTYFKYLLEHFPSVDIRRIAVSNENGETSFVYLKNLPGRSGFQARAFSDAQHMEKIKVQTATLESNLPENYIPSLIKIDVEGAERLVLEGAISIISKYKPIVVFEHGKDGADHYNTHPRDIYKLLHDEAGLRIFDMDGNGPYTLNQFEETYARNDRWNFVAHQ
jgi:FkbM family methyltransferase